MADFKYHYNPKTCQYERARIGVQDVLWYVAGLLITGLIFCACGIAIHDSFLESDTERALRQENRLLEKHKPLLEQQLATVEASLVSLKKQDKYLYTRLFDTEFSEATETSRSLSKEDVLLADAKTFEELLAGVKEKSERLRTRSIESNQAFSNTIHLSKKQLANMASIPSIQPVSNLELTMLVSGFGERINPFHKGNYKHPGIDFAAARGADVFATAPGRVVSVSRTSVQAGYGNYIEIDHGHGFVTRYAHLENINVLRGQQVSKGMVVGTVGSSGGSIAPHLHYEVIRDGDTVDPIQYLLEGLTSEQHTTLLKLSSKQNQSLD